jgi:subtilisin
VTEAGGRSGGLLVRPDPAVDEAQQLILMPPAGLDAQGSPAAELFVALHRGLEDGARMFAMNDAYPPDSPEWLGAVYERSDADIWVLDSMFPAGPKLVVAMRTLRQRIQARPELFRLVPNCFYDIVSAYPEPTPTPAGSNYVLSVLVRDSFTQQPVGDAKVTLFEDVAHALGDSGTSDAYGRLDLYVSGFPVNVERLYIEPPMVGYWGLHDVNLSIASSTVGLDLEPVAAAHVDLARSVYGSSSQDGSGVRIGVVDTGIDPAEVPVAGGWNYVNGEANSDHGDNGTGHGTHIAGIIASSRHGAPQGLAPSAEIFSYRVFSANSMKRASSFSVGFALQRAFMDGCHLVNLSLGGLAYDEMIRDTDVWAAEQGLVLFAAAGNDWGGTVAIPAALHNVLAVTALGRDGTFPYGSLEAAYDGTRSATASTDFLAAFSNTLPHNTVDLIAPGTGILSVRPGGGYGPLSGTSQACAVATAAAARALTNSSWLTAPADLARSTGIKNQLLGTAKSVGLPMNLEGYGMLP